MKIRQSRERNAHRRESAGVERRTVKACAGAMLRALVLLLPIGLAMLIALDEPDMMPAAAAALNGVPPGADQKAARGEAGNLATREPPATPIIGDDIRSTGSRYASRSAAPAQQPASRDRAEPLC